MSLFARLFGPKTDDHAQVRPLWQRVIEIAREPGWYTTGGVADSVTGRFDCLTAVLALVLLRMERDPRLVSLTGRLTELFVSDIDGQLREFGVGDPVMAKRMGKLMSLFGGRLDAYRSALAARDNDALIAAVDRNFSFGDAPHPDAVAAELRRLADALAALDSATLLEGRIAR